MGMPVTSARYWTVDDVWALPDDPQHRYEAVDGELLVSPSPRPIHQRAVRELLAALDAYARHAGIGEALAAPSDVVIPPGHLVQPDVYVIRPLGADELRAVDARTLPLPFLAVEVLSPGSTRADRVIKRRLYQRSGIECWIVDLDARLVECWTPDASRPDVCAEWLEWRAAGALAPLLVDVGALMQRVCDGTA